MRTLLAVLCLAGCTTGSSTSSTASSAGDSAPAGSSGASLSGTSGSTGTGSNNGTGNNGQGSNAGSDPPIASNPTTGGAGVPRGHDFLPEILALFRVAACGHLDRPIPTALQTPAHQKVVDHHCKELAPFMTKYRAAYFGKARDWFVAHQPPTLPTTAVYAFAGGDLVSALVAFPKATEITTLSLEYAGDPRKLTSLTPEQLATELATFRKDIGMLIWVGSNLSTNLSDQQKSSIAAQLSSHLLGLSTGGYEPVAARYFSISDADGSIHYLDDADIAADTTPNKSLSGAWARPAFSSSFNHVEVRYRLIGEAPPTERIHRHIGWNLSNDHLKKHPGALLHLKAKGQVALCVKGASYLLWYDDFSTIRTYLTDHLAWMVTDSTGVAPIYVPRTLEQEAFGKFEGPVLPKMEGLRGDVSARALWAKTKQPMPFRFGYLDKANHSHVVITRPKASPAP